MTYLIEGDTANWEVVIGLEVHAQIISNAKLFSAASTSFGADPNTQVSLVDAALPGMLPVINSVCIEQAVRTGLGLGAKINLHSVFERKNYFYPDLPQGYQISQYLHPIVGEGLVTLDMPDGLVKIGIERLHIEQDAGKSIHDQDPVRTYIDLNRAGIPLMEIVSKPDLRSPEEAGAFLRKLRTIMRYLGTCDGNMEQGSLRCDANVSVRPEGNTELRTRAEIKNINSVRFVMQAISHEAERQVAIYETGGEVDQETRLYDPDLGETRSMRSKEEAHDYRYFPDPDLLPVDLTQDYVDQVRSTLPELPEDIKARFVSDYGVSDSDAAILVADKDTANYFENVAKICDAKLAANWVIQDLFAILNRDDKKISTSPVNAVNLGELLNFLSENIISSRIAKDVFQEMAASGKTAGEIVEAQGLKQISDVGEIEGIVDEVLLENPEQAKKFKEGSHKVIGWFVGQVMKKTQGKANPQLVSELFEQKLSG